MKTFILSIFIAISGLAYSQEINGVWQDSCGTSFKNCIAIFAEKNDSIFMTHYIEFNGIPFVEYGAGIVKGDTLSYNVTVSKQIPGWSTAGVHQLILSNDKKTLRGNYSDNLGNKGAIIFKKISK